MNSIWASARSFAADKMSPAQFLVIAYLLIAAFGVLLLRTSYAAVGDPMSLVDAVFMAASALCVTGLSVVSLAADLTVFGQIVVLALVQVGALGVMTMSTMFAFLLGRKVGLRGRLFLQEDLNQNYLSGVVRLVRQVITLTFVVEGIGALLLFPLFLRDMDAGQAAYFSLFHAVSAFANAGFDLLGDSFVRYSAEPLLPLIIGGLFVVGGLGFTVLLELWHIRETKRLSLQAKIVLVTSAALIAFGGASLLVLEYGNPETIGDLSLVHKTAGALFTAMTARTAGFNVVPTGSLTEASLFLLILLMFVGASPGSTGGGIKTTTFAVLLLGCWRTIRGRKEVEVADRRIPTEQMAKAHTIILLALLWVAGVTLVLLYTEGLPFLDTSFEVMSAFGTVGLSTGVTQELSSFGRLVLALSMFLGRLGPMTLALALGQRRVRPPRIRHPKERIDLG